MSFFQTPEIISLCQRQLFKTFIITLILDNTLHSHQLQCDPLVHELLQQQIGQQVLISSDKCQENSRPMHSQRILDHQIITIVAQRVDSVEGIIFLYLEISHNIKFNITFRCPFMTEGHHYNRPRRFTNVISHPRPYAVHENLWHRQQFHSELRRMYMSPSYLEAPDVPSMNQLHSRHPMTSFTPSIPPHHTISAHNYSSNSHSVDNLNDPMVCAVPPPRQQMQTQPLRHSYSSSNPSSLANNVNNLIERERTGEHPRYRRSSPFTQSLEGQM